MHYSTAAASNARLLQEQRISSDVKSCRDLLTSVFNAVHSVAAFRAARRYSFSLPVLQDIVQRSKAMTELYKDTAHTRRREQVCDTHLSPRPL